MAARGKGHTAVIRRPCSGLAFWPSPCLIGLRSRLRARCAEHCAPRLAQAPALAPTSRSSRTRPFSAHVVHVQSSSPARRHPGPVQRHVDLCLPSCSRVRPSVYGAHRRPGLLAYYASDLPFGLFYFLINLPFYVFGLRALGVTFTVKNLLRRQPVLDLFRDLAVFRAQDRTSRLAVRGGAWRPARRLSAR